MRRTARSRQYAIILLICLCALDKANAMGSSDLSSRSRSKDSGESTDEEPSMGTGEHNTKSSKMSDSDNDDSGTSGEPRDDMDTASRKSGESDEYSSEASNQLDSSGMSSGNMDSDSSDEGSRTSGEASDSMETSSRKSDDSSGYSSQGSDDRDSSGMSSGNMDSNSSDEGSRTSGESSNSMETSSRKSDDNSGYSSKGSDDRGSSGSGDMDDDSSDEGSRTSSDESEELISTTVIATDRSTDVTTLAVSCPPENVIVKGIPLTFDTTISGTIANSTQFCPRGTSNSHLSQATRRCSAAGWLAPTFNGCYTSSDLEADLAGMAEEVITDKNAPEVAMRLVLASNQPDEINSNGLKSILDTLEGIVQVESNSSSLTDSVIGVIDNILEIDAETVEKVPRVEDIIELIEDQLSNVQQSGENYEEKGENVAARAIRVKRSKLGVPFEFVDPFEGKEKQNDKSFSKSTLKLPPSILDQIPDVPEIPLTFFVFRETDIFMTSAGDDVISPVISAKVDMDNVTIRNLPPESRVVIDFMQMSGKDGEDSREGAICVFWYKPNNASGGRWSTEGCEKRTFENRIQCLCNHLTSFAVLVRGETDSERYADGYYRALNLVTSVGCYLSAGVLMLCLILMITVKKLRAKQETQVHMNLCLALIGFYLTFVIGVERTGNPIMCQTISAVIHWFCLSSLAWMSVEAYVIYKVIYKFELGSIHKYFIFYSLLFGWGMPAVSAILVYFLDKSHDYALEPDFCFLHRGVGFYFGFLLLVTILTTYNAIVFVLACYRILCRTINAADKKGYQQEIVRRVWITFLFWVLLGLGWICGIFSSLYSEISVLFQVLFCVSLSLQGLFLFYFLCVQNPSVQKKMRSLVVDDSGSYRINISRSNKTENTSSKATPNVYSEPPV